MQIKNIAVIGFGKLGQSLASVLMDAWRYEGIKNPAYNLTAWDISKEQLNAAKKISNHIKTAETMAEAIKDADLIIIATPSFAVRETAQMIKGRIKRDASIICGSKGGEAVEADGGIKLNTMYDIIEQELPNNKKAILSGPNLAAEIMLRQPTETVIAAEERYGQEFLDSLCRIFTVKRFKAIPSFDVLGIELCAFFKHIPVIASGIAEKLSELELGKPGYAYNAKGAVVAKAIDEIKRLAAEIMQERNAAAELDSVAWIGDIICSASPTGRNYQFGQKLAEGKTAEQAMKEVGETVEGPRNIEIAYRLMKQYKLELPLIRALYEIIFENKNVKELEF